MDIFLLKHVFSLIVIVNRLFIYFVGTQPAIYLVFLAFDVDLGFILTTLITYSAILLGAVSFIRAGVGLTEISATNLLENHGVELSLAVSIILMMRVVTIWFSTVLGFITTKFFISI